MTRTTLIILSFLMMALISSAQNPTTTYPYLYDNFLEGTVVMDGGARQTRSMNIHLRQGALHYIDNGIVREAFLHDVMAVEIASDIFVPYDGRMYRVVAKNENGVVAEEISGDFDAALESEGAYGIAASTSATMKLSSVQTDSQVNQNYMNILNEKESGMSLPVVKSLWLISPSVKVKATKKDVGGIIPEERLADWKAFQKKNKIKWKNPDHLLMVLDYIVSL